MTSATRRSRLARTAALLVALGALGSMCAPDPSPDVNGDGVVNFNDLAFVQGCFGEGAPFSGGCAAADVVADGRIDVLDASRVASELAAPFVPDVVGLPLAEAQRELVAAGYPLGAVSEVPHLAVPSGAVIGSTPRSGTELPGGTPVDVVVSAPVPPESTTLPAGWHGTWAFTTTTRDAATGQELVVETDEVELCAGAPLGLSLVPAEATCQGEADADALSFTCAAARTLPACTFDLEADFTLLRSGDTVTGSGGFALGACADLFEAVAEELEIVGSRTSAVAPGCSGPAVAVSQKLARHPALLEGLRP